MQKNLILALAISVLLVGCSGIRFGFPGVHKVNIEQGNIVTQEMVDQLKPGMTKRQVRFLMGTPMVHDTFHASRWDYVYTLQKPDDEPRKERISLYFDGDLLASFSGDFLPSGSVTDDTAAEETD